MRCTVDSLVGAGHYHTIMHMLSEQGHVTLSLSTQVFSVDWSPDGERVASGGRDRVLKM